MNKAMLLKKIDDIPTHAEQQNGFESRPEDRGNSMRMRLKRLIRYRGAYVAHIGRTLRERIKLPSNRDVSAKTFWGRELVLPSWDSNALTIYKTGTLGASENGLIRFLVRQLKTNDVFYDIGANYGFFTALAQELITDGELHAFEPSRSVFPYLKQLERASTFINNCAISATTGTITFFNSYATHSSGKSTTSPSVAHKHEWDYATEKVDAITLDEYCRSHSVPTIIKIDVEGAEDGVLAGGLATLTRTSPIIAVELWSGEELSYYSLKTLAAFKQMGYTPYYIEESGDLRVSNYKDVEGWLKTEQSEANMIFKKVDKNSL